jgi:hypothetical protein
MTKTLPTGPVWETAKAEKNWFVYRITPEDENGKRARFPAVAMASTPGRRGRRG